MNENKSTSDATDDDFEWPNSDESSESERLDLQINIKMENNENSIVPTLKIESDEKEVKMLQEIEKDPKSQCLKEDKNVDEKLVKQNNKSDERVNTIFINVEKDQMSERKIQENQKATTVIEITEENNLNETWNNEEEHSKSNITSSNNNIVNNNNKWVASASNEHTSYIKQLAEKEVDLTKIFYGGDVTPHLKPDTKEEIINRLSTSRYDQNRKMSKFEIDLNNRVQEQDTTRRLSISNQLTSLSIRINNKKQQLGSIQETSCKELLPWQQGRSVSPNLTLSDCSSIHHVDTERKSSNDLRSITNEEKIIHNSKSLQNSETDMISCNNGENYKADKNKDLNSQEIGINKDMNMKITEPGCISEKTKDNNTYDETNTNNLKYKNGANFITSPQVENFLFQRNNSDIIPLYNKRYRKKHTKKQNHSERLETSIDSKVQQRITTNQATQTIYIPETCDSIHFSGCYETQSEEKQNLKSLIIYILSSNRVMKKQSETKRIKRFMYHYRNLIDYKEQRNKNIFPADHVKWKESERKLLKKSMHILYPKHGRQVITNLIDKYFPTLSLNEHC